MNKGAKMKTLYTVGCSFTKYDKNVTEDKLWPSLLAEKLNYNVINDGKPGGSNQRSFRKLQNFIQNTKIPFEDLLVLIQVTAPFRFEFPDSVDWTRVVMTSLGKQAVNPVIVSIGEKNTRKISRIGMNKLRHNLINYTEEAEYLQYLRQLSQLSFLPEKHQIAYKLISFILPTSIEENKEFVNNNFNWFFPNDITMSNIFNMHSSVDKINLHPDELGNQQIADFMYTELRNSADTNTAPAPTRNKSSKRSKSKKHKEI